MREALTRASRTAILLTVLGNPNVDRVSRRRAETAREIVDAAWAVVREKGWDGLTLRAVAERVGMKAPSLYSHFDSKLAIVDAMYGGAWAEFNDATEHLEAERPDDPREALLQVAEASFDALAADPDRYVLMNQRAVAGFTPSPESFAHAVRSVERLHAFLADIGITDTDAADLYTALISGFVGQQTANEPGGTRWRRLLPRAVHMYADEVGVPSSARRKS